MRAARLAELADEIDTIGSWFHQPTRTARCHEIAEELRGNPVETGSDAAEPPAPDPAPKSRGKAAKSS
jgi:hypothetical protein